MVIRVAEKPDEVVPLLAAAALVDGPELLGWRHSNMIGIVGEPDGPDITPRMIFRNRQLLEAPVQLDSPASVEREGGAQRR